MFIWKERGMLSWKECPVSLKVWLYWSVLLPLLIFCFLALLTAEKVMLKSQLCLWVSHFSFSYISFWFMDLEVWISTDLRQLDLDKPIHFSTHNTVSLVPGVFLCLAIYIVWYQCNYYFFWFVSMLCFYPTTFCLSIPYFERSFLQIA